MDILFLLKLFALRDFATKIPFISDSASATLRAL